MPTSELRSEICGLGTKLQTALRPPVNIRFLLFQAFIITRRTQEPVDSLANARMVNQLSVLYCRCFNVMSVSLS